MMVGSESCYDWFYRHNLETLSNIRNETISTKSSKGSSMLFLTSPKLLKYCLSTLKVDTETVFLIKKWPDQLSENYSFPIITTRGKYCADFTAVTAIGAQIQNKSEKYTKDKEWKTISIITAFMQCIV